MTKTFHCGDFTFKGYFVKAGTGWEIGYRFNNKTYFVSNFIDHAEAKRWWALSQKEVRTFCKNEYYPTMNKVFFGSYLGNFLYTHYYNFLRVVISANYQASHKSYRKDVVRHTKQYRKFRTHAA